MNNGTEYRTTLENDLRDNETKSFFAAKIAVERFHRTGFSEAD